MDRLTISRLNAINRRFYERCAASFDATRRRPWRGWRRVMAHLEDLERPSILDVGCGNGRFGRFAAKYLGRDIRYVGVDASRPLLELARRRGEPAWRWLECDLVDAGMPAELDGERFDLVACFGLMHHLPGESTRRRLAGAFARSVAPGGMLALSFWQLGSDERFARRAVDPEDLEADRDGRATPPIGSELEPNDYLLPWGGEPWRGGAALRYCRHVDAAEAERLLRDLDLERVESFNADGESGAMNLYYVLRQSIRPQSGR